MQSDVGHAVATEITGKLLRALNWFQRRASALIIASVLALAVFHETKKSWPTLFPFAILPHLALTRASSLFISTRKGQRDIVFSVLDVTTFSLVKGASADIENDRVRAKGHDRNKPSVRMQPSKKDKVMALCIISYENVCWCQII